MLTQPITPPERQPDTAVSLHEGDDGAETERCPLSEADSMSH